MLRKDHIIYLVNLLLFTIQVLYNDNSIYSYNSFMALYLKPCTVLLYY